MKDRYDSYGNEKPSTLANSTSVPVGMSNPMTDAMALTQKFAHGEVNAAQFNLGPDRNFETRFWPTIGGDRVRNADTPDDGYPSHAEAVIAGAKYRSDCLAFLRATAQAAITTEAEAVANVVERDTHKQIPIQVWADVDVGIADAVSFLNTIPGVRTHASCQGTIGEGGPAPYRAQVMTTWPAEHFEYLKQIFDVTLLGENWGYLHPRGALPAANTAGDVREVSFQQRVDPWLMECFGMEIARNILERNHRFLEEALELVQANGCTITEAHQLVDYVYGRDQGDINQEVGGVMVTLAALCLASGGLTAGEPMVIYRGDDGQLWVRDAVEFEDGRFEFVPPSAALQQAPGTEQKP